jgi:cytochrome c peroxidase
LKFHQRLPNGTAVALADAGFFEGRFAMNARIRRRTGIRAALGGAVLLACLSSSSAGLDASSMAAPVPEPYAGELSGVPPAWTPPMAALGKRLFSEPQLSGDGSVSCATCHDPDRAFTDGVARARGVRGQSGTRNTPTLVNRGIGRVQFWDGRAANLEQQALGPIQAPVEMDLAIAEAVARLARDASYREQFHSVFGGEPTAERLGAALAAYERTIYSVDSPFDRFVAGDPNALSPAAQRGLELFGAKARCGECHSGPNFTDEAFHSLGVSADTGRGGVTGVAQDVGAFKTPTLREIGRTAPYMHDGSLATLADVVDYYDRGCSPHPNLSSKIVKLGLTAQERSDLVEFLEALSGTIVETPVPVQERSGR